MTEHSLVVDFYDGRSAKRHHATLNVLDGVASLSADGLTTLKYPRCQVKVLPKLRGAPRRIEFPGGAVAVTSEHAWVDQAFQVQAEATLAHRLESHIGFVIAAMVGIAVSMVLGYLYGIPFAAREIAQRMPDGIEKHIAEQGLKSLDQIVFEPTKLPSEKQKEIAGLFDTLRIEAGLSNEIRLEFREGGWIDANALALPGGVVVITDELVAAMPGMDEIAAVLAHELGHVRHRHSLRQLLQSSITAMAAMAIYGDVTAVTGLAAAAPTALAYTGYSRDHEREADEFAFALLKKIGRTPRAFATAMQALERAHRLSSKAARHKWEGWKSKKTPADAGDAEKSPDVPSARKDSTRATIPDYLATHPAIEERIQSALDAAAR